MIIFCILLACLNATATMRKENALPKALVLFRWSDKSRRAQISEEVKRRAQALDGRICMVMDRPFYFDQTRIRIQSLNDPLVKLAVKLKHLEFVGPPPSINQELHIDLLIPRMESSRNSIRHMASELYLAKELQVANDAQYQSVLVNLAETTSQATFKTNRVNIGTDQRVLAVWLLEEFTFFLDRTDGVRTTAVDARHLISNTLWYIWKEAEGRPNEQGGSLSPFEKVIEDNIFRIFTPECREIIKMHLRKIEQHKCSVVLDNIPDELMTEFCVFFPFIIPVHLSRAIRTFQQRFDQLRPQLNMRAFEFYLKQLCLLQPLLTSEDSGYAKILDGINEAYSRSEPVAIKAIISKQRGMMRRASQMMDAMQYYFSVGELLVQKRDSSEGLGKIGIICAKEFTNGDWSRALSDIMQCSNQCVTMKVI